MGFFKFFHLKRTKKKEKPDAKTPVQIDPNRYSEAVRIIAEAENLYQDNSGLGEEKWSNSLVELSPESIKAISARGWRKRGFAEPTNEFLIRVLGRIAKERSSEERALASAVLQGVLALTDDNTTGAMNLRNACVRELDELQALPGVDYSQVEERASRKGFCLDPIEPEEVGPFQSKSAHDKPNAESAALCQLTLSPQEDYKKVIKKFEANYARWSKTFDARSLSLVLCSYGFALEHMERYSEAVLAHRWACKFYPYKGFSSYDILPLAEAKAVGAGDLQLKWAMDEQRRASLAKSGYMLLSTADDFWFRLWDPLTWDCLGAFKAYAEDQYRSMPFAITSERKRVAIPVGGRRVAIWNLVTGSVEKTLEIESDIKDSRLVFSNDNSEFLVAWGGSLFREGVGIDFYDYLTNEQTRRLEYTCNPAIVLAPSLGFFIAVAGSEPRHLDIIGIECKTVEWSLSVPEGKSRHIAYSSCGRFVAFGSADGIIRVWDLHTTPRRKEKSAPQESTLALRASSELRTAEFSNGGHLLVAGYQNGDVVVWDVKTGQRLYDWNLDNGVAAACFAPDDTSVLTGSWDGTIGHWTLEGKKLGATYGHQRAVDCLICLPPPASPNVGANKSTPGKIKPEICQYCGRMIGVKEQAYVLRDKVSCKECDTKLREIAN